MSWVINKKPKKMKIAIWLLLAALLSSHSSWAQDGRILRKKPFILQEGVFKEFARRNPEFSQQLRSINFYRITYLSDGLQVTGYLAEPKEKGTYPCIISNRGGNREYAQWDTVQLAYTLGRMATWKYVVIASQYRGNDDGEGKEELGGKDIQDVLNLIPALSQVPNADTSRIGIEGGSRGGMMTYLALKNTSRFKAAAVNSGVANLVTHIKKRPDLESEYTELIPDYKTNKEAVLKARSAVFWADKMCKTTPLLIQHGSSDWRVPATEALELVQKLYACNHPTRFILYEGATHALREVGAQYFAEVKRHFDYYVREGKPLPRMEPHGP
ncbi:alpha/beta hydrolase family protein [Hymenobacter volaticus]|uniref:Prolyl oligopeptidase family serine peptidase n=1 Tax=Hymenobacter volaticus TaxID=2932254 RepID=A0ABY4GDY7_9BACT|nr:prolyl oligopeptidase family serine peptidase [Hymenobacter volaticus]UOQ69011.1 prolyl oligopeptidase family serine peptidase [Hymenobacter volaticus]